MLKCKPILWILPAVLLAVAVAAWLAGGKTPEANAPKAGGRRAKAPLVEVQQARVGDMARTLEVTGEVVATNTVVIAAKKEGPISYCPWREGDEVNAGHKLVEIDRAVHRAEVETARAALHVAEEKLANLKAGARSEEIDQAKASVQRWKATLDEARRAYERQEQLFAREFTSEQALDLARERMEVAKAELANAQEKLRMLEAGPTTTDVAVEEAVVEEAAAKLKLAQAHLEECVVRAPFNGVVTRVHVRPGDLATPRSALVEMYDPTSLVVRFSVPEAYAAAMRLGLRVKASLDALPGRAFTGEVVRAYPQLDAAMRTRTAEAKLTQAADLMPNQFARLTLELGAAKEAVIIPAEAVTETPQGESTVFVVEAGKAARRKVALGIEGRQSVQVTQGIARGEHVVVRGNRGLKDGAPVRVAGAGEGQKEPGAKGTAASPPMDAEAGR